VEQQVLTIVDLARLELAGSVGTHEVARLAPGMPVQVQVEGVDQPVAGRIARIAPAAEPGTRSIGVTIELPNPKETLRAGQYAVARCHAGRRHAAPDAAHAAVGNTSGQDHVWLIENGSWRAAPSPGPARRARGPGRGAAGRVARQPGAGGALRQPARRRQGRGGGQQGAPWPRRRRPSRRPEVSGAAMWITRVSINNPVFATMVMVALCVLGLFSLPAGRRADARHQLPRRLDGGAVPRRQPEAVEREIIKPLEEAVNSVAGVKRITSRSGEGRGQMSIEFGLDTDMGRAMQDVRDRIAAVQSPSRATPRRRGRALEQRQQPAGGQRRRCCPHAQRRELSILGDQVVGKRLQRVEGVARVEISGLTVREVRIDLDPQRLRAYGVTPAEIATALREANADQPVGLLSDSTQDALLRVEGRVRDPRQFEQHGGGPPQGLALTLGDLGTWSSASARPIRWRASTASGHQLQRLQAAGRQHRGRRRRGQEGDGRGAASSCRPTWSCA
jgi:hypothetical protein